MSESPDPLPPCTLCGHPEEEHCPRCSCWCDRYTTHEITTADLIAALERGEAVRRRWIERTCELAIELSELRRRRPSRPRGARRKPKP